MAEGTRIKLFDEKLARHDELLADLLNHRQDVRNTQTGIQVTLKLILKRLNTIERRSTRVPYLTCEEIGSCVRSIDCECAICVGSDTTCPRTAGCCARNIDCECDICMGSVTSTESEGLNCDETKINQPSHFQVHETPQVELDSLVLGCTRESNLSSLCFSTWLKCVEIKTTRVASNLFDKMFEGDHVQVVHVFIGIKRKFSLILVGKGLVVPIWDPGINLKTLELVGHTNNVRDILMDMTSIFCLRKSLDNINPVRETGWQWFMHFPVVHVNSIYSVAAIPTYSHVYSGIGGLSLRVTKSSRKEIMLLSGSILLLTLHDDSKQVATIDLSTHNWLVDGCTIWKASQRRGSVMARSLFTARAKGSLEELHVCKLCQPWLFDFILLVALNSGALNFCSRLEDGKATWLQITRRELLVNWSTKTEVKVGTSSLGTFWKDEFARSLITFRVEVVGLYILLSNTDGSASLRDEVARVRTMVYDLYFPFDPGGVLIGLENKAVGLQFQNMQESIILLQHTCTFTGHVTSFFPIPSWSPAYGSKFSSNVVHIVFLLVEKRAWKCVFSKFTANIKRLPCVDIELRHVACWKEALKALCYKLPMNFVEILLVEISMLQNGINRLFDDASGIKITEFIESWEDRAKYVLISRKEMIELKFDVVPMAIFYIWPMVTELYEVSCGLLWGISTLSFAVTTPSLGLVSWRTLRRNQRNEKLQVISILMTFVPENLLTMEGYNSHSGTTLTILQSEKSSMLAYMNVDYSKLTNGYKEVMCLVGLREAVEDIEVVECPFGMVPSFHQIGWCPYSLSIHFSSTKMQSKIRKTRRLSCLVVMLKATHFCFPFDPGISMDNLKKNTTMIFNLIAAAFKAHGLSHQFPFDPGGSSIKRFYYLSDCIVKLMCLH